MCRAIRDYHERTGFVVGFKPAGGIRTAKDALAWLVLIKEELGDSWLNNKLFRLGLILIHYLYGWGLLDHCDILSKLIIFAVICNLPIRFLARLL